MRLLVDTPLFSNSHDGFGGTYGLGVYVWDLCIKMRLSSGVFPDLETRFGGVSWRW